MSPRILHSTQSTLAALRHQLCSDKRCLESPAPCRRDAAKGGAEGTPTPPGPCKLGAAVTTRRARLQRTVPAKGSPEEPGDGFHSR